MVRQYPYTLQQQIVSGGGKDDNGNYTAPSNNWVDICYCRDEHGNGKKVTLTDGNSYEYSFLIQLPRGTEPLAPGTKVRVMDNNEVRAIGDVVHSRKDQLHSRIWV